MKQQRDRPKIQTADVAPLAGARMETPTLMPFQKKRSGRPPRGGEN